MADFTSLNGYTVKDPAAGKSLSMSGSSLSLLDGAGAALSTVVIPTGNVKFSTFKESSVVANYGSMRYIDDAPILAAQPGDFIVVPAAYSTARCHAYWNSGAQSYRAPGLVISGVERIPVNQQLTLLVTSNSGVTVTAAIVYASPKYSFETMLTDIAANTVDAWDALHSWKPIVTTTADRAVSLFKDATTQMTYQNDTTYRRLLCYTDGTYASLIPLNESSAALHHTETYYTNAWSFVDPNPCFCQPEAITATITSSMNFFKTPLYPDDTAFMKQKPVTSGLIVPDKFAIVFGQWH